MNILLKLLLLGGIVLPGTLLANAPMTLQQAERYALDHAPELRQLEAKSEAEANKAIANGQLSDPKLSLGANNVPTDSFSFTQENMTQVQVGLFQQLPKGNSLSLAIQKGEQEASATKQALKVEQLNILKEVRSEWLSLYYFQQKIKLYQQQKDIFKHWEEVVKSKLASGEAKQNDVVRATLEVSQLEQLILKAKQEQHVMRAKLNRWIGDEAIDLALPSWPKFNNASIILDQIKTHPQLVKDTLESQSAMTSIKIAGEQYKPGVGVGVMYGLRQGDDSAGEPRSDFVGAQVTMDIPLFTSNRQDKVAKASEHDYINAQQHRESDYNALVSQFEQTLATLDALKKESQLYQTQLLSQADYYTQSTEIEYQNQQTDFLTLVRAYIEQYQTQVDALKVEIEQKQAEVQLLYLQGK